MKTEVSYLKSLIGLEEDRYQYLKGTKLQKNDDSAIKDQIEQLKQQIEYELETMRFHLFNLTKDLMLSIVKDDSTDWYFYARIYSFDSGNKAKEWVVDRLKSEGMLQ
ncbi:hypothetical protein [Methanococcoides methylutens]|uniref:hypothetical protein n=1 Tax=Methanococcoides methylutens TaxID=2226 RepID=UPI00064EB0C8|nr:hypothetical protein [Methanococcoides methylutens]